MKWGKNIYIVSTLNIVQYFPFKDLVLTLGNMHIQNYMRLSSGVYAAAPLWMHSYILAHITLRFCNKIRKIKEHMPEHKLNTFPFPLTTLLTYLQYFISTSLIKCPISVRLFADRLWLKDIQTDKEKDGWCWYSHWGCIVCLFFGNLTHGFVFLLVSRCVERIFLKRGIFIRNHIRRN